MTTDKFPDQVLDGATRRTFLTGGAAAAMIGWEAAPRRERRQVGPRRAGEDLHLTTPLWQGRAKAQAEDQITLIIDSVECSQFHPPLHGTGRSCRASRMMGLSSGQKVLLL